MSAKGEKQQKPKKQFNISLLSLDTFPGLSRAFVDYVFLQADAIESSPQTASLSAELSGKRHGGWSNIPLPRCAEMLVDGSIFFSSSLGGGTLRFSIMKDGSEREFITQPVRRHPGVVSRHDYMYRTHVYTCTMRLHQTPTVRLSSQITNWSTDKNGLSRAEEE